MVPATHRAPVRLLLALFPLLAAGLAGCVDLPGVDDACPREAFTQRVLETNGLGAATDPAQPWDAVVLTESGRDDLAFNVTSGAPWTAEWTPYTEAPVLFGRARLTPGDGAPTLRLHAASACPSSQTTHTLERALMEPRPGEVAQAGQGVHVHTAGFWENGTMFYTNYEPAHAGDWPRAGWYAWEGGDPLPVYVYDEEPSEKPAYWDPTAPAAGTPVNDNAPYAYYVTIPGFNEALKGLSSTTSRVTWMPPEDAYTRPGAESHSLYGDALVFWIRIVDVVDVPCPAQPVPGACDAAP